MVCDHRTLVWKKNTQQFPPHFIWLAKLYWHAWIVAQVRSGGVNDWLPVQGWGFGLGKQGGGARRLQVSQRFINSPPPLPTLN